MIDPISGVGAALDVLGGGAKAAAQASPPTFSQRLEQAVAGINSDVVNADHQVRQLILGQSDNLHGVMIAIENAHISLDLMVQVRNRMVDAYQDIMRMQI